MTTISYLVNRFNGKVVLRRHTTGDSVIKYESILPEDSRRIMDSSPVFEMGYAGTGPEQLALAILLDALHGEVAAPEVTALNLRRDYMWEFLSASAMSIDETAVEFPRDGILAWYRKKAAVHA